MTDDGPKDEERGKGGGKGKTKTDGKGMEGRKRKRGREKSNRIFCLNPLKCPAKSHKYAYFQ